MLTVTPRDLISLREINPFTIRFELKNYQPIGLIALPFKLVNYMIAVGFEPTKHDARDLESLPFDRSGTLPLTIKVYYQRSFTFGNSTKGQLPFVILPYVGLEPTTPRLEV